MEGLILHSNSVRHDMITKGKINGAEENLSLYLLAMAETAQ